MTSVLLAIHLLVTVALIVVVLLQRSEGGGLGIGSGSGGMGSFMSGRGTANLLTRATAILGALFFALSLTLALLHQGVRQPRSLLESPPPLSGQMPSAPASPTPASPGTAPAGTPPTGQAPAGSAPSGAAPSAPAPAPAVPTN